MRIGGVHIEFYPATRGTYRSFDDGQPTRLDVPRETLLRGPDKGRVCLDRNDPKPLGEIKLGITAVAQTDIVNERGPVRRSANRQDSERAVEPFKRLSPRSNQRSRCPVLDRFPQHGRLLPLVALLAMCGGKLTWAHNSVPIRRPRFSDCVASRRFQTLKAPPKSPA